MDVAYQCFGLCGRVCPTHPASTEEGPVLADTVQEALRNCGNKDPSVCVGVCVGARVCVSVSTVCFASSQEQTDAQTHRHIRLPLFW